MSSNQDGWIEWTETKGKIGKRSGWRLWFWWVLATGLDGSLILIAINWLVFLSIEANAEVDLSGDNALFPLSLFGCGLLFFGPLVGLAQGLALRFAGRSEGWGMWMVSDTVGVVMAIVATIFVGVLTAGSENGWIWVVVPGAMLGIAQQLVLRSSTRRVVWWIPITWVSWVVGALVGVFVSSLARNVVRDVLHIHTETKFDYPFYPPESAIYWSVGLLIGTLVFSAMTGFGLVWLLQQPMSKKLVPGS